MGLHPACYTTTTLAALDAAGIAIMYHDEGWFIAFYKQEQGPYSTLEIALEISERWLAKRRARRVGEDVTTH